jgi:crotonobetainyl-CoA:carnitine CoA-transferase CaiB-like acyl-CoA transferase
MANGVWSNSCQVQAALCGYELAGRPPRAQRGAMGQIYHTADERSFIVVTTNPARDWPALCRVMGREDWLTDERYATPMLRLANSADLIAWLAATFATETFEHWREVLHRGAVTLGIVGTIYDHIADEQMEANGLFPEIVDGEGLRTVDSPFQINGEAKTPPRMAPGIGQHTRDLLEEFGCSAADIEALVDE